MKINTIPWDNSVWKLDALDDKTKAEIITVLEELAWLGHNSPVKEHERVLNEYQAKCYYLTQKLERVIKK